jgi:hypothetical protein
MPFSYVEPTIAAGESLSDGVDVSGGTVIRITTPGPEEWVKANMTFQVSSDGVYYSDAFNDKGEEIMVPGIPHWCTVFVSGLHLDHIGHVKVRSGTRANPVVQPKECKMAITLHTDA